MKRIFVRQSLRICIVDTDCCISTSSYFYLSPLYFSMLAFSNNNKYLEFIWCRIIIDSLLCHFNCDIRSFRCLNNYHYWK